MPRDYRVNERIRVPQVLVIDDAGEQLGLMTVGKALEMAREKGLDLVEVAPQATPPVCRILDYGKLRYLASKKEHEAKKGQKSQDIREVRFRPKIGIHDFAAKVRKVKELIDDGSKVKVSVVFRGREVTHPEIAYSMLKKVAEQTQDQARLESPPGMDGRGVSILLAPGPKKIVKKTAAVEDAQAQDPQGG